ncbi:MAG: hypothetical protein Q4A62_02955 [Eikenella sp.]|nr:hypothetical protein [Eikenella sp.]
MRHLFLCLLLLSSVAAAHGDWLGQAQQINSDTMAKEDPSAKPHLAISGSLAKGQARPYQIELTAGRHYTFFADCDRRCSNIHLVLLHDGSVLKANQASHAFPVFGWPASENGNHTLTINMEQCAAKVCDYSIQVFEGRKKVF